MINQFRGPRILETEDRILTESTRSTGADVVRGDHGYRVRVTKNGDEHFTVNYTNELPYCCKLFDVTIEGEFDATSAENAACLLQDVLSNAEAEANPNVFTLDMA